MKKFTFKTEQPTGKWRSFHSPVHDIKYNKRVCGHLTGDNLASNENVRIKLAVLKKDINEDNNPNCPWKWIQVKETFKTLQEAKDWLNENRERIFSQFKLYLFED